MKRRDFLKTTGWFVVVAGSGCLKGCGGGKPTGRFSFPQGVASGDPRESSVVLWTRAVAEDGATDPIDLRLLVAEDPEFRDVVVDQEVTATAESDHTVRVLVTELAAGTRYHYRFENGGDGAEGRTMTAPAADDGSPVRLAWVSCQDFGPGTYGAWRQMLNDDLERPEEEQIQAVVHLGDFIYETIGSTFQQALDESFEFFTLPGREIPPFPDSDSDGGETFARTLADYRHLYKHYLSDPDLRAARARWPFICTWDDHEFTNDSWQTQANYTDEDSLDEPAQTRKVAANQAWFEFIPAQLSGAPGVSGVEQDASDFAPAEVEDASYGAGEVDAENRVTEANNIDALSSMTIYRSLRFGRHVELVMTDERSYRSDHAIPEELTDSIIFFEPRNALPIEMVNTMDAGMTANGGDPPDRVQGLDNARIDSPPGTMLGADQKAWWKETMMRSDATWKIWGNSVPLMRLLAKNAPADILVYDRIISGDAWDGYNSERVELLRFLRDNNIRSVVAISGDIHAHAAGVLMHEYDIDTPQPVAAELVTAGISSNSLFALFENATRDQPQQLRELITYDGTELGGSETFVNNLNVLLLHGTSAAVRAAETNDPDEILAAKDPEVNPHLRFTDTNAQGYGLMTVTADQITATLVTINRPITETGEEGPGVKGTATFTIPKDAPEDLSEPDLTGEKPFPF